MTEDDFEPFGRVRLLDADGNLKCETSVREELLRFIKPGDKIQRLYVRTDSEWRDEEMDESEKLVLGQKRLTAEPFLEKAKELAAGTRTWGISCGIDRDMYVLHEARENDTVQYYSPVVHYLDGGMKMLFDVELDKVIPEKDWRRTGYFSR